MAGGLQWGREGDTGIWQIKARDAARHPPVHRMAPPGPNVSRAKVEKLHSDLSWKIQGDDVTGWVTWRGGDFNTAQ